MTNHSSPLQDRRVLIVGGTSGIGLEIARQATAAGAHVILAGRDPARVRAGAEAAGLEAAVAAVDLTDEASIRELATGVGRLDAVVSLAADHANGPVGELEPAAIHAAFDAKVIGPILLVKHLELNDDAAVVLFSGIAAWRPAPGLSVMAATNAAVAALANALATEIAPRRVVTISPGIVDSGAWDGDGKQAFFTETAASLPVGHVGASADVASAVLLAITNPFISATTLHVDGGALVA
jgi:NAD(P)-dependent dehydrogenase (short-subunit alcohol dehydrogenase family)